MPASPKRKKDVKKICTNIYIDGFNLYYLALKDTSYKWLDVKKMCEYILPKAEINKIYYCTAIVKGRAHDINQPIRQQAYIRALETIPNLKVVYGAFRTRVKSMKLVRPIGRVRYVNVYKTEEKGSDVNLATYLLRDGFLKKYEQAVIISNDADLREAVEIVTKELGLKVGILYPSKTVVSDLEERATFVRPIRKSVLKISQFDTAINDKYGIITKPSTW